MKITEENVININNHLIGAGNPCYIVAEIGVNHNGDPHLARELFIKAKEAGADAVKLQLFTPEELVSPQAELCSYQEGPQQKKDQLSLLKSLVLPPDVIKDLKNEALRIGISTWASVFDFSSLALAMELDFPAIKLGSGELTNLPLHEKICRLGKPVILSCGMAETCEIRPVARLYQKARASFMLLHCVSAYPAPDEELNLRSIEFLRREFNCPAGFSDHTSGIKAAPLALACGAVLIEKHLTLDHKLPGPDHKASLDAEEFKKFVNTIRQTEKILGHFLKTTAPSEIETREKMRKSIALKHALKTGHTICLEDLSVLRPGIGISPMEFHNIVGKKAAHDMEAGHILREKDLFK